MLEGLSSKPRYLSSRYFYDDAGSELFRRIMSQPEYYPPAVEAEVLTAHAADITAPLASAPFDLVDLGAGDASKTLIVLRHLVASGAQVRYVPVDISEGAMRTAVAAVRAELPDLEIAGVVASYEDGLQFLRSEFEGRPRLVFFLGSNIGNFDRPRAEAFLRRLWTRLHPGDRLLVGFDLKKDIELLLAAYNDRAGVTAEFNLNLLRRINRELGADFDLAKWRHYGTYDVFKGAMVSYLVSLAQQTVRVEALRRQFRFRPWEPLHTEYSYKYLPGDIHALATSSGFRVEQLFEDPRGWFVNSLWRR